MAPRFFATPAALRAWFEANHRTSGELTLGYYKRGSGRPSVTWPESVDVALCFGWIDGVRHSLDAERYQIRFTPRKPTSIWSTVNVRKMKALLEAGLVVEEGKSAFARRDPKRSGLYSFEQRKKLELPPAFLKRLKADATAWSYFQSKAPWYQRAATHWVVSAKRDETKERRFAELLACCAAGRLIGPLTPPGKK